MTIQQQLNAVRYQLAATKNNALRGRLKAVEKRLASQLLVQIKGSSK